MAEHRRIRVLIPAAGQSVRYQDKGYAVRKPFLTVKDRHGRVDTMLGHVVRRVPLDVALHIAVPEGYEYVDHHGRQPVVISVADSASQVETVARCLSDTMDWDDWELLVIDADTMAPVAGMLEFIDYLRPEMAVAVTKEPDEWMGRVDRNFIFSDGKASGEFGIVGMRYFQSMKKLADVIHDCGKGATFTQVMNAYASSENGLYHVQWFEDWGTPEKLAATGAEIA